MEEKKGDREFCLEKAKEIADRCKDSKGNPDTVRVRMLLSMINHCIEYSIIGSIVREFCKEFVEKERKNQQGNM